MECPHGEPRGEMYCPFCRREKGIKFIPEKKIRIRLKGWRIIAIHYKTYISYYD